jgi:hypothetical protein
MKMISLLALVLFLTACNNSSDSGKAGPEKVDVFTTDIAMEINTFTLRSGSLLGLVSSSVSGDGTTVLNSAPAEIRTNCSANTSMLIAEGISMAKTLKISGEGCPLNSDRTRVVLNWNVDVDHTWVDTIQLKDSGYQEKYGVSAITNKTRLQFSKLSNGYIETSTSEAIFTLVGGESALLTQSSVNKSSGSDSMTRTVSTLVFRSNELKSELYWTSASVSDARSKYYFNGKEILKEEYYSTGIGRLQFLYIY